MTFEESLAGRGIPEEIKKNLTLVSIRFFSFEGNEREGQLVVHGDVADEVRKMFDTLLEMKFPIEQVTPVVAYGWDDGASMAANNSSAFNYRLIAGTDRLSNHAYGRAIDINPMQNPYTQRDGLVVPAGAQYDLAHPGTITEHIASVFKSYGWEWGGNWAERKDWQHFEKPA